MTNQKTMVRAAAALSAAIAGAAASAPTALAATVLTVSGNGLIVATPMDQELRGALCAAPNTCVPVDYPSSAIGQPALDQGALALRDAIAATPDDKVVMAYSQGGIIATTWLQEHAADTDAPPADDMTFVLFGNPQRGRGGLAPTLGVGSATPTDTGYQVVDVAREYDAEADWPQDPRNGLAVANALAGYWYVHTDYTDVDVNSPDNLVSKDGDTTYVLVPTEKLPLLEPLRRVGLTGVADQLNDQLKPVVDGGYDRSGYAPLTEPVLDTPAQQANSRATSKKTTGPTKKHATIAASLADKVDKANRRVARAVKEARAVGDTACTVARALSGQRRDGQARDTDARRPEKATTSPHRS